MGPASGREDAAVPPATVGVGSGVWLTGAVGSRDGVADDAGSPYLDSGGAWEPGEEASSVRAVLRAAPFSGGAGAVPVGCTGTPGRPVRSPGTLREGADGPWSGAERAFDPARPDHYRVGDGWEKALVIEEPILVREGTLSSSRRTVVHRVTVTRHGPLIEAYGRQWALRWTGIERTQELTAFFLIDRAQDWDSFRKALSAFPGPSQNFVYADVDGHVIIDAVQWLPVKE